MVSSIFFFSMSRLQSLSYLPSVDVPSAIVLDFSEEEQKLDSLIQVINNILKENESE